MDPIVGYQNAESAPWYFGPKATGKETIMDPFHYEGTYMVSVINPIVKNGKFFGITGVDMGMDFVQKLLDEFNIYDKKGSITILSDAGSIVASSKNPKLAGQATANSFRNIPASIFTNSQNLLVEENDTLRSFAPFKIGNSDKKWVAMVEIPRKALMASSNNLIIILAISGILTIILLVYGIYIFTGNLTKPIVSITNLAEQIALGDYQNSLHLKTNSEEVVKLHSSFEKIIESQKDITSVCKSISENDFSKNAIVRSKNDELSISVNKMIENLQLAAIEDKKRNWTTEGLALFADLLSSETDLGKLSDVIISKIIKYLEANQGAIFMLNGDNPNDPYLELIACYAYDRKKHLNKKVGIGEGLVGQCYLEKSHIVLSEIPKDYIKITSGLGTSNPSFVLLMPMMREEEVLGVIEIASFKKIEDYQIKFIEKLAESIASSIYNININSRTTQLLNQSQMQTEAMRAQEEEMRQNMEELQATQEEMFRKEQDYLAEIARLKENNMK